LTPSIKAYPAGDHAITFEFAAQIDEKINRRILALFFHLKKINMPGILDIIPAYCSLTIVYDQIVIHKLCEGYAYEFVRSWVEEEILNNNWESELPYRLIEIPVCYDASIAPDLNFLAKEKKLTVENVIQLHSSSVYHVFMIGFLPGFAYMGKVDECIAMPRKSTPSIFVKAGSVGIAGEQTGIYPLDSPGGWNIIGRTPLPIFNASREEPVLLSAGDKVRFVPISLKEFYRTKSKA